MKKTSYFSFSKSEWNVGHMKSFWTTSIWRNNCLVHHLVQLQNTENQVKEFWGTSHSLFTIFQLIWTRVLKCNKNYKTGSMPAKSLLLSESEYHASSGLSKSPLHAEFQKKISQNARPEILLMTIIINTRLYTFAQLDWT